MSEFSLKTYVSGIYRVSTIYRQSFACVNSPPWYYETLIWKLNKDSAKQDKILNQVCSGFKRKALTTHFGIVTRLEDSIGDGREREERQEEEHEEYLRGVR